MTERHRGSSGRGVLGGKKEGSECVWGWLLKKWGTKRARVDRSALSNMPRWRSALAGGTDHEGIPVSIRDISKTGPPRGERPTTVPRLMLMNQLTLTRCFLKQIQTFEFLFLVGSIVMFSNL